MHRFVADDLAVADVPGFDGHIADALVGTLFVEAT